jgi:MYXO-CTERM domain-containing protein
VSRATAARLALATVALATQASVRDARANGAFPASGQVLVDPADPLRLGARTTYGLVASSDGGASWRWTCEDALAWGDTLHPQLAITPEGTVYGGLGGGMIRGRLGACAWSRVASLEGSAVVDVTQDPEGRSVATLVRDGETRGEVWRSDDDAATWSRLGDVLPAKLSPLTVDVASNGRIYVSGLIEGAPVRGFLAWSDDEGASWGWSRVLDADASKAPYIAAVDPLDPDVVWVRLTAAPGELVVTRDGGATWEIALVLQGFLRAFALSPDGSEILAGGEVDGLLRSPADTLDFERIADVAVRCAQWREGSIDVCGSEAVDGFTVARSTDDARTFQPLYVQRCLLGPEACAADSAVGACAEGWPALMAQLGVEDCDGGGGAGGEGATASSGASGGSVATATSSTAVGGTGAGDGVGSDGAASDGDAASGTAGEDAAASGGCGCRSTPAPLRERMAGPAVVVGLVGLALRRRRTGGRR